MAQYAVSGTFALTATTAKTVLRIMTPASRKGILRRIIVTDAQAGATDAGLLARILTGGTDGTGTSVTPTPLNAAAACVSTAKANYTVEPTGSPVEVWRTAVPSGGGIDVVLDGEQGLQVAHSSAIALELTAANTRGSNTVGATLIFEE